jgi:hypothetical protein
MRLNALGGASTSPLDVFSLSFKYWPSLPSVRRRRKDRISDVNREKQERKEIKYLFSPHDLTLSYSCRGKLLVGPTGVWNRDSIVGIATRPLGELTRNRVWFPTGARDILRSVYTGSGANTASYTMETGEYFPVIKRPGRETPSSSKVKCV